MSSTVILYSHYSSALRLSGLAVYSYRPRASYFILRNALWGYPVILNLFSCGPETLPVLSTWGSMSLVPFLNPNKSFFWFHRATKRAWWHCPWMFHITHGAVAAGSRRRRADDACALDQSHPDQSGGAPSASSRHLPFGNPSAAETRSNPSESKRKDSIQKLKEHLQ